MIKKWTIAAVAYLVLVMAGYGVYSAIEGPEDAPVQHEQTNH
ncbi:hypothetical protein [Bacillus sp. FJAT-18017]|nr:hypothetical protein [Bacillus sp. FJAT-18017]